MKKYIKYVGVLVFLLILVMSLGDISYGSGHYTRDPNNPVIPNANGECVILKEGGIYHLFFAGCPPRGYKYDTFHATSTSIDGSFTAEPTTVLDIDASLGGHGGLAILMNPSTHEPITKSDADLGIGTDTTQKYWMFYASSKDCVSIANNDSLYGEWETNDAYSPCLCSTPSGWDSTRVGWDGLVVIEDGGVYKMLFQGDDGDYFYKVGLATSDNLVEWTKYDGNPVMEGSGTDLSLRLGPSDIWKDDTGFTLVITDIGRETYEQLSLAYSTDLINWTKDERNPLAVSIGDEFSISDFAIFREDGKEYIFYEASGSGVRYGIFRMWRDYDTTPPPEEPPPEEPPPEEPPPSDYTGTQWEYLVEQCTIETPDGLEEFLNLQGEMGWELVDIESGILIFKRAR